MQADHLIGMIKQRIASTPGGVAMRAKVGGQWRPLTYGELGVRIDEVAAWLIERGIERGDRVAIFAANCPEWTIADLAVMAAGGISVPVYATNTGEQAAHVLADAGARIAFVGSPELYDRLASVPSAAGLLDHAVLFEGTLAEPASRWTAFASLHGCSNPAEIARRVEATTPNDVATIIYTSGTTGDPKGVVLTYANLASQFRAVDLYFQVSERDRSLAFLPLSHAYERTWSFYVLLKGAENYYLGDPKAVIDAMQEVRPTCMVSVPRLYEKIYATALFRLSRSSTLRRHLFEWALDVGARYAAARKAGSTPSPLLASQHAVADRLVLRKIRDIVGGPKNFFSAGGAALSMEIEEFFFAAGLLICQGYGLTETSPMLTCNRPRDFKFGTVGKPIEGCEIRIAPDGEILARGTNVTPGYYNRPAETAEAFADGWFKTGDIGQFDEDGFLRITDRKKDLIITSGGKNVAPSRIESVIGKDYYIEQVAAVGEGRHYLAALVVPHFDALEEWARERGLTYDSLRTLVRDARVVAFIAERIERQQTSLAHHERIKRFALLSERFSQMGGEITPTLKNIRTAIAQKYEHVIDGMYAGRGHDAQPKEGGGPDARH